MMIKAYSIFISTASWWYWYKWLYPSGSLAYLRLPTCSAMCTLKWSVVNNLKNTNFVHIFNCYNILGCDKTKILWSPLFFQCSVVNCFNNITRIGFQQFLGLEEWLARVFLLILRLSAYNNMTHRLGLDEGNISWVSLLNFRMPSEMRTGDRLRLEDSNSTQVSL